MKKTPNAVFFLLSTLFISGLAFSQHTPSNNFLEALAGIETARLSVREKTGQLEQLQKQYRQWHAVPDSVEARILHRLGDFYEQNGNLDDAIKLTRAAVRINSGDGGLAEKKYLAHSYFNLGRFFKKLYNLPQSHRYYDSSIYWCTRYPEKNFIALMAYEEKAFLFFQTGDYAKSTETAGTGLLLATALKDSLAQGALLAQRAQAALALGRIEPAGQDMRAALAILPKASTNLSSLASAYSIYAAVLAEKKDWKGAVTFYQKSLQLNRRQQNWAQCSRDLLDLGYLYDKGLNKPAEALRCYAQGITFVQKANDPYLLAGLYNNTGVVYWRRKAFQKALSFYQKGLTALPLAFSDTALQSNPSPQQLKLVANDYFVSTLLANKGESLLLQYKKGKDTTCLRNALLAYEAADRSVDAMRWKQAREESKLYWRQQTKAMYAQAIETCYELNDAEKAFYFFEKSRAVLLNDRLSELGARRFLPQAEQEKEQQLQTRLTALQRQLPALPENSEAYSQTYRQIAAAQTEWDDCMKSLEAGYPVYYRYKYNNKVPSVDEVRKSLSGSRQSLVEYFINDSILYILAVTPQSVVLRKSLRPGLRNDIDAFLGICARPVWLKQQYALYQTLAHRLYQNLFEPLGLSAGRVVISPDEHFIPFDVLLSGQATPSGFLLNDYAFSYAYSAGLLLRNQWQTEQPGLSFLGVAPVVYAPRLHLQTLKGADESLNHIRSYFHTSKVLTGEEANRRQLLSNLSFYKIVQLYSHADADSSGREPVLYLADSALYLSEINQLSSVRTDMAVLSACNTGVGQNARGEGVFSLARAFAAAGVPCTLTTLWQIENQATYRLTELFYQYLSKGLPRDVALQQAKLRYLESNEETQCLPYFWAANVLIGKTGPFIEGETTVSGHRYFVPLLLALIGLGGLFVLFRIKRRNLLKKQGKEHQT